MTNINTNPDNPDEEAPVDLPTSSPFDSKLTIVTREQWGAQPPDRKLPMPWLPTYIRFVHTESSAPCTTRESCIRDVRELQTRFKEEGSPDINFNFLVGEGGTIYEGRGWKTDHEVPEDYREVQGKCISIAYMGNYKYEAPPWEMMVGAFNLLLHGINCKLLSPFFDYQHLIFDKPNETE